MRRALALAVLLAAAACTPPAPTPQSEDSVAPSGAGEAEAPDPARDAMTAALAPAVEAEIGRPVSFTVTTMRTEGEWGWLVAQPWTPEGAQIDWSTTSYAERARDGALDGAGTSYALLRRENGRWRVVALAVGPTDVAWADWPERYGAPQTLFALPEQR